MSPAYFLTGTDTEIGKTFVTCALLHRAQRDGLRAVGLKPIAAGTDAAGLNEDVENIRAASSVALPSALINPYCFAPAIAPHIAAAEAGVSIDFTTIKAAAPPYSCLPPHPSRILVRNHSQGLGQKTFFCTSNITHTRCRRQRRRVTLSLCSRQGKWR